MTVKHTGAICFKSIGPFEKGKIYKVLIEPVFGSQLAFYKEKEDSKEKTVAFSSIGSNFLLMHEWLSWCPYSTNGKFPVSPNACMVTVEFVDINLMVLCKHTGLASEFDWGVNSKYCITSFKILNYEETMVDFNNNEGLNFDYNVKLIKDWLVNKAKYYIAEEKSGAFNIVEIKNVQDFLRHPSCIINDEDIKRMSDCIKWEDVHKKYNYMFRNPSGKCYFSKKKPIKLMDKWEVTDSCVSADSHKSLTIGNLPWYMSLIERVK